MYKLMKKIFYCILLVLLSLNCVLYSQVSCSGSFGTPIFNETFGTVANSNITISSPLVSPAFTTYNYVSVFPPNDGQYTISNKVEQPSWNWHTTFDHTIDDAGRYGNMLVVNCDYAPGEFYRRRVTGLCQTQIYRFSTWLMNVSIGNVISPNVTMKVVSSSGVTLGSVNTGSIASTSSPIWRNFIFDFQTSAGISDVDVILINNASGGIGNDIAIDDITFSACGAPTQVTANIPNIETSGICGNNQNVVLMANLLPNPYTNANYIWQKSTDNGISWSDLSLATNQNTITIPAGSYLNGDMFRFKVGEGNNVNTIQCSILSSNFIFKINSLLIPPTINGTTICENTSATLNATGEANAVFNWYSQPTGGSTIFSGNQYTTPNLTASTSYYVESVVNSCISSRTQVNVNINALPDPPSIISPINYCQNQTTIPLTATGNNLLWYISETGGTGSSTTPTPNSSTVGTQTFWVSQSDGNCESLRSKIEVIINPPYNSPTVSTPLNLCHNQTANALTAIGTNLKWYTSQTGGTGNTTAPILNTSIIGSQSFWVSQSDINGNCESARKEIVVNVVNLPSPPVIGGYSEICVINQSIIIEFAAIGTNLKWYDKNNNILPVAPIIDLSVLGDYKYYVSQTINGCESPKAETGILVKPRPEKPIVTSPLKVCLNETTATLTATGINLTWYDSNGIKLTSAPTPSTTSSGTTSYFVTQTFDSVNSFDPCESDKAEIQVIVNPLPLAPIVASPITYCLNGVATVLTASGTSLTWYDTSGVKLSSAPIPDTSMLGSKSYWVSQTDTTLNCESARAEIVVNITQTPKPIVSNISYCQNQIANALTATGTNLLWYGSQIGGIGTNISPIPNTTNVGTQSYWVSQTDTTLNCESERAEIIVTINPPLLQPTISTPLNLCHNQTANALTANGTNLKWYTTQTGGTGNSSAPIPNTLTVGTTSYWVSQSDANGNCESARAEIVVNIIAIPIAPIVVSPINYCQNQTTIPLTATGNNLLWYNSETGGTGSSTAPTPNSSTVGTQTFWVTQSNGNCESARSKIEVKVLPIPISTTLKNETICDGNSVILDAGSGFSSYSWNTNPIQNTQSIIVSSVGSYSVTIKNSNGCSNTQTVQVIEGEKPVISNIISTDSSIEIIAIGGNTPYLYSIDGIVWQSSNIFSNLSAGIYLVFVQSANGGCIANDETSVLKILNIITPNNDNKNDAFTISNLEFYPNANLKIFDRYGKLIKELDKLDTFKWDGKYIGRSIPSGTYWYILDFGNGKTKTAWIVVKNYK